MATYYRNCVGKNFNSGIGKCPLNAGHVKAIILIEHGQILPATLTVSSIEVACHANRPARIYPLKHIVEFAPEGGEAQTSENGYGGTKIVGYSAFNPIWTMADNDFNLRMNIVRAKGMCYFKGEEHMCYLFEQAGRQVSLHQAGQWYATMPEEELKPILARDQRLQDDWDPTYGDRMQKIVFIGIRMDINDLRQKLEACLTD